MIIIIMLHIDPNSEKCNQDGQTWRLTFTTVCIPAIIIHSSNNYFLIILVTQWDESGSKSEDSGILVWKVCILICRLVHEYLNCSTVHGVHYPQEATYPEGTYIGHEY